MTVLALAPALDLALAPALDLFLDRYIYLLVLSLLAIGLYGMLAKGDLAKKVVGMTIYSTAIFLFFIEGSLRSDATTPVIDPALGTNPDAYVDPLPHLLILTAIVVGVGVLGVGLALLIRIHRAHGTFDEVTVAARLADGAPPIGSPEAAAGGDDGRHWPGPGAFGSERRTR